MTPAITHQQFAVLRLIRDTELSGFDLRAALKQLGVKKSLPAFYQAMARMEDDSLVSGRYEQKVIDGQIIKQRLYRSTAKGRKELERVQEFYAR